MDAVDVQSEIEELRQRLDESEATLAAIRNGEVDAIVIGGKEIYTLEGADHPYRVLVEAMKQGAVTLSPGGSVVYCNTGFSTMVRRPIEKIIGVPIQTLFVPGDHLSLGQHLSENLTGRQTELTLTADDGTFLPVLVSFNLLQLEKMSAVCLVITDLTEHKHNLELRDTDRRKDEFLAMLAHELRNPLAPIANAALVLSLWNQGANEEVRWACNVIDRQVRQMTRIVDDLLDVSRITRGKITLKKTVVDVSSLISAAVETSRPLIESRKHRLSISLASGTLQVEADVTRMAQVLTNLLNNAAKYTEERGEIGIRAEHVDDQVMIAVCDNGVGISSELLPTVFELFTQADRTIDRSQGGLGIGLTLARSLVELHGGSVRANSEGLGRGSEFVVLLPMYVSPAERDGESESNNDAAIPQTAPQRILVVDDNLDSAATLELMLKTLGHEATSAHDGPAAITSALKFKPNLVILDIGLPGMNGYMVAEHLRTMPEMCGVVLAALTGYGEEQDRRRSKEAGFNQHFVKPLSFTGLQELIRSLPSPKP
jgi:signal transduction histidine kinase/CheY-like chemotaxis protein